MSGHSKWATIKHKKGQTDARRGKAFTKALREIEVAARMGGGDPDSNPRLRTAIQASRDINLPKDNVDRAIKKATGNLDGVTYEDFSFEGYGAGGVALMVEGSTDNKNRTTPEIRHIFGKWGGNLGEHGCVAWMFSRKGIISIEADGLDEDATMEVALEAGAEDFESAEGMFIVTTAADDMMAVREQLEAKDFKVASGELQLVPANTVRVEGKDAEKVLKLTGALEDQDDVTLVAANFDIDPELVEQMD